MSIFTPTIGLFEKFVPDLLKTKAAKTLKKNNDEKSANNRGKYCLSLLKTATIRWIIIRSLYDEESDYWFHPSSLSFQCVDWLKNFQEQCPNSSEKTTDYWLFEESTDFAKEALLTSLQRRYNLSSQQIDEFLSLYPFQIEEKTIRNNFAALSTQIDPLINKIQRGTYEKLSLEKFSANLGIKDNSHERESSWESWGFGLDFLTGDVATIVELLVSKIQGKQRLFIHHNYVVPEGQRDLVANHADFLKEIWKKNPVSPLEITYFSASLNIKNNYFIYPVCLYYYQRAYYLCAFGQAPSFSTPQNQWYNYRLERILKLKEISWEATNLPFSEEQILRVETNYNPEAIQT